MILNGAECFRMKQFKDLPLSASTIPTAEKQVNSHLRTPLWRKETISIEVTTLQEIWEFKTAFRREEPLVAGELYVEAGKKKICVYESSLDSLEEVE